jgi:hypothetical protein
VRRALFERNPDRFPLGSGTGTGMNERWKATARSIAGYRAWLTQLPPEIVAQIAHGNAQALFGAER